MPEEKAGLVAEQLQAKAVSGTNRIENVKGVLENTKRRSPRSHEAEHQRRWRCKESRLRLPRWIPGQK